MALPLPAVHAGEHDLLLIDPAPEGADHRLVRSGGGDLIPRREKSLGTQDAQPCEFDGTIPLPYERQEVSCAIHIHVCREEFTVCLFLDNGILEQFGELIGAEPFIIRIGIDGFDAAHARRVVRQVPARAEADLEDATRCARQRALSRLVENATAHGEIEQIRKDAMMVEAHYRVTGQRTETAPRSWPVSNPVAESCGYSRAMAVASSGASVAP